MPRKTDGIEFEIHPLTSLLLAVKMTLTSQGLLLQRGRLLLWAIMCTCCLIRTASERLISS